MDVTARDASGWTSMYPAVCNGRIDMSERSLVERLAWFTGRAGRTRMVEERCESVDCQLREPEFTGAREEPVSGIVD